MTDQVSLRTLVRKFRVRTTYFKGNIIAGEGNSTPLEINDVFTCLT